MITNLRQLYIHQLRDLYSAETQILDALPKMAQKAKSPELRDAFTHHLKETQEQKQRLDTLLARHNAQLGTEKCVAIQGILDEGDHLMSELSGDVTDPGLIAAAQRVEHYEIAAYGTAKEYADVLDLKDDIKLLEESLGEEGNANKKLTKIATGGLLRSGVNEEAVTPA